MKITIKLQKVTRRFASKPNPFDIFRNLHFGSNNGNWGYWNDNNQMIGFHFEKHRKKVVGYKTVKGKKVRKVEPAHWMATYYIVPVEVLKAANLKITQKSRHFKFENKK